jgi:hypothetical protein
VESDLAAAQAKLADFPQNSNQLLFNICDGINAPAKKLSQGIQAIIGQYVDHLGDYQEANLPFFQGFVVQLADNLLGKFLFGENVTTGELLTDAVGAGLGILGGSVGGGSGSGSLAFTVGEGSNPNESALRWNLDNEKDFLQAIIQGPGVGTYQSSVSSGVYYITPPAGENQYILSMKNKQGQVTEKGRVTVFQKDSISFDYVQKQGNTFTLRWNVSMADAGSISITSLGKTIYEGGLSGQLDVELQVPTTYTLNILSRTDLRNIGTKSVNIIPAGSIGGVSSVQPRGPSK